MFNEEDLGKSVAHLYAEFAERKHSLIDVAVVDRDVDGVYHRVDCINKCGGCVDDSRAVGSLSVRHETALVDVGVDGMAGHAVTVIPHVTESYNCSSDNDSSSSDYPYCVLKSFPFNPLHGVDWAAAKVDNLVKRKPERFNEFFAASSEDDSAEARLVAKLMDDQLNISTWAESLIFARNKFEKYFNHKPRRLLSHFPLETEVKSGQKFWSYPKRAPTALTFDPNDSTHASFVACLAELWAGLLGIAVPPNYDLKSVLQSAPIQPFVEKSGKRIVVDESVSKDEAMEQDNSDESRVDLDKVKHCQKKRLNVESLDEEKIRRLIVDAAFLRCESYGIPLPSVHSVVKMAEKVCSCPAPVVDVLTDLAVLECRKLRETGEADDWWISLAPEQVLLRAAAKPVPRQRAPEHPGAPHSTAPEDGSKRRRRFSWSLWDKLEVRGNCEWTLQRFLDTLLSEFGLRTTMVVQGTKMIFVESLPTHKARRNKL